MLASIAEVLAAILLLTGLAWGVRRVLLPGLCPLCAGVTGTWMALLAALWAGLPVDPRLPAVLLGGSVVGLAGLGETALAGRTPGAVLAWKTAFVTLGFATAYALLAGAWPLAAAGGAALAVLWALPRRRPRPAAAAPTPRQAGLAAQLKNCC